MRKTNAFVFVAAGLVAASGVFAADPPAGPTAVPADNTRSNQTDRANTVATADSQGMNQADMDLTQQVRKSVMADSSLSTYAHNIKIISQNGTVTLNGVVRSAEEKSSVEQKAIAVAGNGHVVNWLKIAPPSP